MTNHTMTYNNSGKTNLPSGIYPEFNRRNEGTGKYHKATKVFILFLLMMVMGVGNAWADTWNGTVAAKFASGSGTQADPYIISNAAELAYFGSQMNGKTWYVELAADIDLNNREWTYGKNSATNFKGHFDGNGKTISKLKIVPTSAKNNGFFSSLQGTAASRAEVKNLIIDGVTISQTADLAGNTITGALAGNVTEYTDITIVTVKNVSVEFKNLTGANYVGGFVGRVEKNKSTFTSCSVENPSIDITGNISGGASYIGGVIGQISGSSAALASTINGLTVTKPTVTINKVGIKDCFIGSVFGRVNTYTMLDDIDVSDPALTYKNTDDQNVALNLGTFTGGIAGVGAMETAITNVDITGKAQMTLGTGASNIKGIKAGIVGFATTKVRMEGWNVASTDLLVKGSLTTTASQLGGFAGNLASATTVKTLTISSSNVNVTTNISIASYIGGVFGDIAGASNNITTIDDLTLTSPTITINKNSVADTYLGSVFGRISTYSDVKNISVSNPTLTYNNDGNPNAVLCLGTFAGYVTGTAAKETSLTGITITGTAQLTLGTEAKKTTAEVKAVKAGIIGQATTNSRLEDWTVEKTRVQVYGKLTTAASHIGTFAGNLTGAANAPTTAKNIKINNDGAESACTLDITGDVKAACYLGGFVGIATTNCQLEECTVKKPKVTLYDINTETSYTGGAIGDFLGTAGNTSTIKGFHITAPSVSIDKISLTTSNKECYMASVFGRINNYTSVTSVDVFDPMFTCNATTNNKALYLGTFAGRIVGANAQETVVSDVTETGTAQLTIGTDANKGTNVINTVKAGFVAQVNTNVRIENWNVGNTNLQINGSLKTGASYLAGFAGNIEAAAGAPLTLKNLKITGTSTINVTGNVEIGSFIGGFVGKLSGKNALGSYVQAETIKVGTTNLTISGQTTAASYYGGLAGQVTTACTLNDWSTTTGANLTFNNSITALSFVGGAIGSLDGAAGYPSSATGFDIKGIDINFNCDITTKGIYVGGIAGQLNAVAETNKIEKSSASGKIYTTGSHKYTPGNLPYVFGGIVGYAGQNSTTFSEINNCVSEVNFDLSGLSSSSVSGSNYNLYSGFVVGGVVGRINTPYRLPESLYYSGKIYAPFAMVGPIVGVFNQNTATAAYAYNDYSGENVATAATAELEIKEQNWYYNGYKIGLSSAVTSNNTTESPVSEDGINYLTIGENTLTNFNSISGTPKHSKTILAYTASGAGGINPAWSTNSATYAADYMYYMQGVNRGNFVADDQVATIKEQVLSGAFALLTLTDANADLTQAANRGVITHTLTATASAADSFKWYVDGVEQSETSTTCDVKPLIVGSTVKVEAIKAGKVIKSVECKVNSVPRVGKSLGTPTTYGTKNNPYLIGSAEELQLLSYLSTLPTTTVIEQDFTSANHYNRAYYKMDADIDLSEVDNFIPISFAAGYGANGMVHQDYVFCGFFDGDKHKITGLNEEWYGGVTNANDSYTGWGLFSIVGGPATTVKVGEASASVTTIKNLIIDGATLTHRASNVTFNFNNSTANNNTSSSSCIGVLAGIVSGNTKIDNIEIRNSKITDEGSSDYSLATRGLYVGGAVGSIQNAFNDAVNTPTSTKIQNVAAQVDITLEKPIFADATAKAQVGLFNIGGIIGRICATGATFNQVKGIMPAHTLYSGNVVAPKAWISPVLASVRYADQQGLDFPNFSKHWDGNNNSTNTQLAITNAQYYNYRINGKLITPFYPVDACVLGVARPIMRHIDGAETQESYDASLYQGVNYSVRFIDSEGTTLRYLCASPTDNVYWKWEKGFPHLTTETYKGAYITVSGHEITVKPESITPSSYRWQVSYDGETWQDIEDDDATSSPYSVMPSSKDTRLFVAIVTANDGNEYRTQAEVILRVYSLFDPYISKSGDATSGYTFTLNWKDVEPSKEYSASYQWYKADKTTPFTGQTGTSLTLSQSELDAAGGYIWCQVQVQEKGEIISKWMLVAGDLNVVYVNGNKYTGNGAKTGIDTNDGRTPQTPVKTIDKANSLLDGGPWDKNIIVVMGILSSGTAEGNCFKSRGTNPATLTGKWDGIDYEGEINLVKGAESNANPGDGPGKDGLHNYVSADTKFENLVLRAAHDVDNMFLELHGHDVCLGKGLRMQGFRDLSAGHGNLTEDPQTIPEFSIILTSTNPAHPDEAYWTRTKPQVLTIESGHYGRILGGRYVSGFFTNAGNTSHSILATAKHPAWAVINIDIDPDNDMKSADGKKTYTCDVNCIVAGLTDGSIYGDYQINIHGGNVRYAVGANQGNSVVSGDKTYTPIGGNSGKWGQWPNASFFGRTIINVEQKDGLKPITLNNLYAGGLGRNADANSNANTVVDMYVYGHTEINMKSGTVSHNVYGGGAGGVIGLNPWDAHIPYATNDADNASSAIFNGVQYGDNRVTGAWSTKNVSDPLVNVVLHKIDEDGNFTSETEVLNLANSSTTLNITGGNIGGNVFGGGNGYVSNMPILGTMQGVGSVFGISNVNISGGTISGSVYGGSEGNKGYHNKVNKYNQTINHIAEMNGTVNLKVTGTDALYPTIGGNIYGAGMGIETVGAEEYLRIATAGNKDLGDEYKTDINITIDMPESIEFPNDIYGGGALGKVDGTTNIVLKQGKFTGNIYGGGYGELNHRDKAMVTGTTNIYTGAVDPATVVRGLPVSVVPSEDDVEKIPTIYGGGNMAQVTGNTFINLYHGNITADVFGGGRGLSEAESKGYSGYGWVNGNTRVLYNNTTENNNLTGNIYGGGALGAVQGNTTVVIKGGEVDGDIFGGGKGEEGSEKAKVTGNTNVIVDSGWTEP